MIGWPPTTYDANRPKDETFAGCVAVAKLYDGDFNLDSVIRALTCQGIRTVLVGWHADTILGGKPQVLGCIHLLSDQARRASDILSKVFGFTPKPDSGKPSKSSRYQLFSKAGERVDIRAISNPLLKWIWTHPQGFSANGLSVHVPTVEGAIAFSFSASRDAERGNADRLQDLVGVVFLATQFPRLDMDRLRFLGDLVCAGGGEEVLRHVRHARAGRTL